MTWKNLMATASALVLALVVAACGTTDHGGYASPEEGCQAMDSKVVKGPVVEGDEVEHYCANGKIVEAPRNHVRGPNTDQHTNSWSVDEDSLVCADGTEITTGDEAGTGYYREKCEDNGGGVGGAPPAADTDDEAAGEQAD